MRNSGDGDRVGTRVESVVWSDAVHDREDAQYNCGDGSVVVKFAIQKFAAAA